MESTNRPPMTDDDRCSLTPQGEAALDAATLRKELPSIYDAVQAMAKSGNSPEHIARHAGASGATDNLRRQIESAARHLQASR